MNSNLPAVTTAESATAAPSVNKSMVRAQSLPDSLFRWLPRGLAVCPRAKPLLKVKHALREVSTSADGQRGGQEGR